ncbi:MAG: DNA repair exonuclease [Clostridiales bacterium]|nr:DNA repair exonuclease [Clostridiales bacterium]
MNSYIKIAHCADVHLAPSFAEEDGRGGLRLDENTKAFFRMMNVCRKENVTVLLIAGDLFDQVPVSRKALQWFLRALEKYEELSIVLIPGNHDPDTPDSPYAKEVIWPSNVTLIHGWQKIEIRNLPVTIWGCGYQKERLDFKEVDGEEDRIQIGLFHGTLGKHFTEEDLEECGFDYVALGHIHKRSEPQYVGNTCYAYSGCLCGRGFDEQGEKGFYIATVEKGQASLTFYGSGAPKYRELSMTIKPGSYDFQELVEKLRESVCEPGHYRIHLVGERTVEEELPLKELEKTLSQEGEVVLFDERYIRLDQREERLSGVKKIYAEKCRELLDTVPEEEKEIYMDAMRLGLRAFSEEVDYRVYQPS